MIAPNLILPLLLNNFTNLQSILNISNSFRDVALFLPMETKCQQMAEYLLFGIQQRPHTSVVIFTKNSPVDLRKNMSPPFLINALLTGNISKTLEIMENSMDRFNDIKILFIFVEEPADQSAALDDLFTWCWKTGALSVVASFFTSPDPVYSFDPFPIVTITIFPVNQTWDQLFIEKAKNLQGTILRRVLVSDFPRSFPYTNDEGEVQHGGYTADIISEFIHQVNATMVDVRKENGELFDMFEAEICISEGKGDLPTLVRSTTRRNNMLNSRSIATQQYELIVPFSRFLPASSYIILPFQWNVWVLALMMVVFIASADYLHVRILESSGDFGKALCHALLGICSQSIPSQCRSSWRFRYIRFQLIVIGFILTNLYLAHLSSFMTTRVSEPQMKTIKDIKDRGQKLLMIDFHFLYFDKRNLITEPLREVITTVDQDTFAEVIFAMNGTYGLCLPPTDKRLILLYQSNMKRPVFYRPGLKLAVPYVGSLMRKNASFIGRFNRYVSNLWASGLIDYWRKVNDYEIIRRYFKKHEEPLDGFEELGWKHIEYSMTFLIIGLSASIICFVIEMFVKSRN
ncbi:unnamed protein product [Hermetia illucens]|uniref:Ionotropic receptor n=2 Tax=Hermetia illucens TaxID=343691 RepID=A0A7R8V197_HERIL|nr:unnamed protein product [Hermetia illucens]